MIKSLVLEIRGLRLNHLTWMRREIRLLIRFVIKRKLDKKFVRATYKSENKYTTYFCSNNKFMHTKWWVSAAHSLKNSTRNRFCLNHEENYWRSSKVESNIIHLSRVVIITRRVQITNRRIQTSDSTLSKTNNNSEAKTLKDEI